MCFCLFATVSTKLAPSDGDFQPPELKLMSKRSTQVVPSSPASCDQPSTPEHPPPSPTMAIFGIQQKINPDPKVPAVAVLICYGLHQPSAPLPAFLEDLLRGK